MKIIYVITKLITFPGAFSKGFLEHIFCRIFKVNIYAADKYVTTNTLSGHVSMLPHDGYLRSFFVCFLPGAVNFIIALGGYACAVSTLGIMGIRISDPFTGLKNPLFFLYVVFFWFFGSMMCNLFPYYDDALHAWKTIYGKDSKANIFAKVILFIPSAVFTAGAYLEKYGITFLVNIALGVFMFRDILF